MLPTIAGAERAPDISLTRNAVEAEIRRRATDYLTQRRLTVNYYRIRRRLAYPLPLQSLVIPSVPVPTIPGYPWSFWLLWELEERVNALGWAAEWSKKPEFARCASRDLEALTEWPQYYQFAQPDLTAGHTGRLLWVASTKWRWVSRELREKLRAACVRHVEQVLPQSDKYYGEIRSKQDLLALPRPYLKLHNIPLIGTVGAALTAAAAAHPAASALNERLRAIMAAVLELRTAGYTEGVGYDGYVLDFVADWLGVLPGDQQKEILGHRNFKQFLEESYMLAAPGAMEHVAELSDVEPKEMPFHYSAQAKLARFAPDPTRAWYLPRYRLDWMRADALAALQPLIGGLHGAAPESGGLRAQYAVVLRTGWDKEDLAVVMSCTNSQTGHLQLDNGTLVLGNRGRWIVSDPGYQQYMGDSEREFTIGPSAHNYPIINGIVQDKKEPRLMLLDRVEPDVHCAKVELAGCYPGRAGVQSVVRSVWLNGRACVVVGDQVRADHVEKLTYNWHLHPDAALWFQDGWALVHLPDVDLWITSPQAPLADANLRRLPGSRGQLTLATEIASPPSAVWWIFALAEAPPRVETPSGGQAIQLMGKRFQV